MLELVPARFARPDPSSMGALLVEPLAAREGARLLHRQGAEETLLGEFMLRHVRRADALADDALADDTLADDAAPDDAASREPDLLDPDDVAALATALSTAQATGAGGTVLLRLAPGAALQRDVTLPLAAEAGLDRVLAYEMDRLTPFAAADVFFAWRVLRRDREAGRLSLRLSLVPRPPLLPLLEALRQAGAGPQAIEIPAAPGRARLRIPLAHERSASARRERRLLAAALGACAALALLAVLLPFVLQSVASARLDRRIAALQPRVAMAQALHRRIAGSSAGAELVQTERRRLGDTLEVIAAMTRVLPDDSYLSDLTLRQGQLTISGQSAAAAKLIPVISADPAFSAPAFAAPVTRIEGQNTDLFSIRAGVAR